MNFTHRTLKGALIVVIWQAVLAGILSVRADADDFKKVDDPVSRLRPWTSQDSIAVRYFDYTSLLASPDGKYFFLICYYGVVATDKVATDLIVYSADTVRNAFAQSLPPQVVKPLRTLTRYDDSGKYITSIFDPKWESDSSTISFRAIGDDGKAQVYAFDIRSGETKALTDWPEGVGEAPQHDPGFISATLPRAERADTKLDYPVHVVTPKDIERTRSAGDTTESEASMVTWVSFRGRPRWEVKIGEYAPAYPLQLSPDGRYAIQVRTLHDIPASWGAYDRVNVKAPGQNQVEQFVLIDGERETARSLLDAPIGEYTRMGLQAFLRPDSILGTQVFWSADSKHVVLFGAALPLDGKDEMEHRHASYIVDYDMEKQTTAILEPLEAPTADGQSMQYVRRVDLLNVGHEILVEHGMDGKPGPSTIYVFTGNRWERQSVDASRKLPLGLREKWTMQIKKGYRENLMLGGGVEVFAKESMNEPPMLFATDGRRSIPLTTPDPALKGIILAHQEPFEWSLPDGNKVTGGLLLPENHNTPVPLVIQVYRYDNNLFRPDGPGRSPYAAQQLVGRGMAVLNVPLIEKNKGQGTIQEGPAFSALVESAADELARRGLIDRKRVALIGFSRAAGQILLAITHPGKYPPVAAVLDDGVGPAYQQYLFNAATGYSVVTFEREAGGNFWENKNSWLNHDATFTADQVQTPALIAMHSKTPSYSLITASQIFGALTLTRRPFEYLYFPDAGHGLNRPWQRIASQETTLDWISFWAQDYEDPDLRKSEQYGRWHFIKNEWERQRAWESAGHPAGSRPPNDFKRPDREANPG